MAKILVRIICFFIVAAISTITAAQNLWSYINSHIDAEILYAAADSIGPFLGFETHGDKGQQNNVIQLVVNWISTPIGIAAGFAALFILEVILRQRQNGRKSW